jgi:putative PIG3 family NAD(P)H quinone oxidoreductase
VRAIVFAKPGDAEVLALGEAPAPPLVPGALRIRVAATAVNRADLLQRRGFYPPPPGASPILGLECAGEVVEVAPDVADWRVGERAMALLAGGGYAEEVVVDAGSALRVPAKLSLEEAAALPEVFLTVFSNVFQLGSLAPGGWVLVHGGGSGIGTAAIGLAKLAGARILVTAGSDEKCERCRALGADAAINYRTGDFVAEAQRATGGQGVDVVLDSIGAAYFEKNLAALRTGGRLVLIGLMGGAKAEVNLAVLLARRLSVIGSTLRSRSPAEKAAIVGGFRARFGRDLEAGALRPVVDRVLPLERAAEAHRLLEASEHFGKVVLRVAAG